MKKLVVNCLFLLFAVAEYAEEPQQKFSPEKFQADMEAFITKEACLTPQEAAAFFPLYREMQKKQRALYSQMQAEGMIKPASEDACKKLIQKRDQVELELKAIQQTYHNKFFGVMPASKVWDVMKAEDRYHRGMFRNWGRGFQPPAVGGNMRGPRQGQGQGFRQGQGSRQGQNQGQGRQK